MYPSFQGRKAFVCNLQYGLTVGPVYHVYKVQCNSEEPQKSDSEVSNWPSKIAI